MRDAALCVVIVFLSGTRITLHGQGVHDIDHLSLSDGLPHRTILSATYDHNHLRWLSTGAVICRDDGHQRTAFTRFAQTFQGVLRRDRDSLLLCVSATTSDSVEILDPARLLATGYRLGRAVPGFFGGNYQRNGYDMYYAKGDFVFRFRPGRTPRRIHRLRRPVEAGDRLVAASDSSYCLLRGKTNALERWQATETTALALPARQDSCTLHEDLSGDLWIGTPKGLFRWPHTATTLEPGPTLPSGKYVNQIFEDQRGQLILGHLRPDVLRFSDLIAYQNGQVQGLDFILALDMRITRLSGEDFNYGIDVATHGGLYRVTFPRRGTNIFRNYLFNPALGLSQFGNVMRGFTIDDSGNVYVNKDSVSPYWFRVNSDSLTLDTLVMQDNAGRPAVHQGCGTNMLNYRGDIYGSSCLLGDTDTAHVYRYRPADDQWTRWALPVGNQKIRWMMPGRTATELLLITEGSRGKKGGLFYFSPEQERFTRVEPAGPEEYLESYPKVAYYDSARVCVWIGTLSGLYQFSPRTDSLRLFTLPTGSTEVSAIHPLADGQLLTGTFKRGLQQFDPEQGRFTAAGGIPDTEDPSALPAGYIPLPSNDIAGIDATRDGQLLIATFNGLSLYDPAQGTGYVFTREDGLPSNEFNTPSLFFNEHDERWYLGGINGFTSFQTSALRKDTSPYKPALLRIHLLDRKVGYETTRHPPPPATDPLVIAPTVSYFTLDYTIPDYSGPKVPLYQTRLVGLDAQWRPPEPTTTVRYTSLPPGNYTFLLRAIDRHGRPAASLTSLAIIVERPWYATTWFRLLLILLILGAVLCYVRTREAKLRREYRARRRVQRLELQALRQQLNPHFISNAMNAIRDFVLQANPEQAADYLNDFARLMRLFLEVSRQQFTPIKQEAELLERYIRLEQLRFWGKFTYAIEIDPAIDPGMDEVPALMLQPIVENAINHGLRHLAEGGKLRVSFALDTMDDEIIICEVVDNGIGRKIAARMPQPEKEHVSRATSILEDRQRMLADEGDLSVSLTIEDLYPARQHTGTRVTLRIAPTAAY